jgi:hypothetical protein
MNSLVIFVFTASNYFGIYDEYKKIIHVKNKNKFVKIKIK